MDKTTTEKQPAAKSPAPDLFSALQSIALALQQSIHSRENVYAEFQKQVVTLGLRGGLSDFDEKTQVLSFRTVAFPNPIKRILDRFEKRSKTTAVGFSIPVTAVDVYQQVTQEGKTVFVPDTSHVTGQVVPPWIKNLVSLLLKFLGGPPGIFAPLIYEGEIKGMLNIVGPNLTESDTVTMQAFANQIAVALENAALVEKLNNANLELEAACQKTLAGWVRALDLRDNETEWHTQRTAEMTLQLAEHIGVPRQELPHLRRGALMHDIGKMAIPDNILRKPGPLSEAEWVVMKRHPLTAYEWLEGIDYLKPAVDIPYCHHEHWDGSGYGRGIIGSEIPFPARIFSVIDVWDAMRSDRPYRNAITEKETLLYIQEQSGKLFDPVVVNAFLN